MQPREILIVDLADGQCPSAHPDAFSELLRHCFPVEESHIAVATALSPDGTVTPPDCVLLRPSRSGGVSDVLPSLKRHWADVPVLGLLCTEHDGISVSQALSSGLDDFVLCPFRAVELLPRIDRLCRHIGRSSHAMPPKRFEVDGLIGQADCFVREVGKIPLFAHAEATVLITGETGTGKELFARAIHYHSGRNGKPFVPVNCSALPDQLFENEMFGHIRGAFTHAISHQQGLVAEAEGGTLFLDEIDTLSPSAQTKLLRFLQDRQYRPLGSAKTLIADVRIITATNADLTSHVRERLFREDLYYRLNILSLSIPPLRDRLTDIPSLVAHFMGQYGRRANGKPTTVSPGALRKLMLYPWPGNVRELEGVIQRGVVLSSSAMLDGEHLELPAAKASNEVHHISSLQEAKASAVRDFERAYLVKLLAASKGNVTHAAKAAGKERRAFQRLIEKHKLDRRTFQQLC